MDLIIIYYGQGGCYLSVNDTPDTGNMLLLVALL